MADMANTHSLAEYMRPNLALAFACTLVSPIALSSLAAQSATMVYKLGTDTLAVEQYTRTGNKMSGDMVQRSGLAVVRFQYDMTLGADGRPTAGTMKRMQGDGTAVPNQPSEARFKITADSIVRELVWPDSLQRRAFAAKKPLFGFPTFVYGPTELLANLRRSGTSADSVMMLGFTGNPGYTGFTALSGDSVRLRGGSYAMVLRFDANSRLQSVDGSGTTNKAMAVRGTKALDIAAMGRAMKPTGVLSTRDVARGSFGPGGIVLVDYGRPQVRERSVWGGTLVPFDSVWRAGANDATHLMTTRVLSIGDMTLAPGMYTLWVQHTRNGTFLIVNKGTGQWGTQYDATKDIGRVALQVAAAPGHVEEFTIAVRAMGANRGALDMSWGPSIMTVPFGVAVPRP